MYVCPVSVMKYYIVRMADQTSITFSLIFELINYILFWGALRMGQHNIFEQVLWSLKARKRQ